MDQIRIRGLELFAKHGVSTAENVLGQKFRVNATIYAEIREAAADDNITRTVHYGDVCSFITEYMQSHMYKLIETVADRLAEEILLKWKAIRRIDLEVEKPWAPIGLPLENVSVSVSRKWETVYLSAGSNLGDRKAYLDGAVSALQKTKGIQVISVSDWINTAPYGGVPQDDFLNGVICLETFLSPQTLLRYLQNLEQKAGRERTVHWGPRTLDLDILFYGKDLITEENLVVPHPDLENRRFVLEPMVQIAPYLRHPATGETMTALLKKLPEEAS